MSPTFQTIVAWIVLGLGLFWLFWLIRRPPVGQPPRILIGRVLMPVSEILFGASILMQPITAQTMILPIIAAVLTITALVLELRYRVM